MSSLQAIASVVIGAILPALGCSSTSAVLRPDLLPPDQRIGQANAITDTVAGKEVDVEFEPLGRPADDPSNRTGELAAPDRKSFLLLTPAEEPLRIPFEGARRITYRNGPGGTAEGLFIGGLSGAVAGLVLNVAASASLCSSIPSAPDSSSGTSCGGIEATPVLIGALLGGVVGSLIGFNIGHRTIYTF